jgi:hypothetical protein
MAYDVPTLRLLLDDLTRAHLGGDEHHAYVAMGHALAAFAAADGEASARKALADLWHSAHVTESGQIDIFVEPVNVFLEAVVEFCAHQRAQLDAARQPP